MARSGGPSSAETLPAPPNQTGSSCRENRRHPAIRGSILRLGLLVAFVSGLTSLAYQTLWTRLLASGTGNSTYVFTVILALFLVGIALGAIAFNIVRPRIRNTVGLLAITQLIIAGLVVFGGVWIIPGASSGILDISGSPGALFGTFLRTSAIVVLPATFVMGLSFPAASALVSGQDSQVGSRAGLILAVNTIGAIAGTFVVPFAVIPLIGSPSALGLIAIVNAALAVVLVVRGGFAKPVARGLVAGAGALLVVVLVVALAAGGVFVDPSAARIARNGGVVLHSAEDEIASVRRDWTGAGTSTSG